MKNPGHQILYFSIGLNSCLFYFPALFDCVLYSQFCQRTHLHDQSHSAALLSTPEGTQLELAFRITSRGILGGSRNLSPKCILHYTQLIIALERAKSRHWMKPLAVMTHCFPMFCCPDPPHGPMDNPGYIRYYQSNKTSL